MAIVKGELNVLVSLTEEFGLTKDEIQYLVTKWKVDTSGKARKTLRKR